MFSGLPALKRICRHSGDAYSLPIRENGDCCGAMDNGCIHYGLYTSISGQGGYLDIAVILVLEDFSKGRLVKT